MTEMTEIIIGYEDRLRLSELAGHAGSHLGRVHGMRRTHQGTTRSLRSLTCGTTGRSTGIPTFSDNLSFGAFPEGFRKRSEVVPIISFS